MQDIFLPMVVDFILEWGTKWLAPFGKILGRDYEIANKTEPNKTKWTLKLNQPNLCAAYSVFVFSF